MGFNCRFRFQLNWTLRKIWSAEEFGAWIQNIEKYKSGSFIYKLRLISKALSTLTRVYRHSALVSLFVIYVKDLRPHYG